MLIRRFTFTLVAFIIFVLALFDQGMIFSTREVSRETTGVGSSNHIHEGTSQDGVVVVSMLPQCPDVSINAKIQNHSRTMRAFRAPLGQSPSDSALYIESFLPHTCFLLSGDFHLSQKNKELLWTSDSALLFYASIGTGEDIGIVYDVGTHEIKHIPTTSYATSSIEKTYTETVELP